MNDVIRLMKNHRSVRDFIQEVIPKDVMESIIDAGRMASTWKNQQAYSIVVLSSQKDKG